MSLVMFGIFLSCGWLGMAFELISCQGGALARWLRLRLQFESSILDVVDPEHKIVSRMHRVDHMLLSKAALNVGRKQPLSMI